MGRVWRAISDPAELAQWFPNRSADWKLTPGHMRSFGWDDGHGGVETFPVRVEMVDPPTYLSWSWGHESTTEAVTLVEWTLSARPDGGTTLHIRESGFAEERHRMDNTEGWDEETAQLVE